MRKINSVKESLISYVSEMGILLENNGLTGPNETQSDGKDQKKSETPIAPPPVDDPDKNASNPEVEELAGYSDYNSLLFLVSKGEDGIIKRGENIGWIELTKDALQKEGKEVDLEDFQWWCPAEEFEEYLKNTGRKYDKDSGDWTSEDEDQIYEEPKKRKINSYLDFLNEKEEPLNEITGIPFLGNIGPSTTSKGMAWSGEEAEFEKGKLSNTQRRFVKFYFTKNRLRKEKKIENQLNLNDLKEGEKIEIFICPYDPQTGKSYPDTSVIGITYLVDAVIKKSGDLKSTIVVGTAIRIAPDVGVDKKSGLKSVLDLAVSTLTELGNFFTGIWNHTSGKIFTFMIAGTALFTGASTLLGLAGQFAVMWRIDRRLAAMAPSAGKASRLRGVIKGLSVGRRIKSFILYPATLAKRTFKLLTAVGRARKAFQGWKAAKYIVFGTRLAKAGRYAGALGRVSRVAAGAAKITNPVGWILLATDAIGSFMNYTSDNQAPSWDPFVGGEGDAMLKYKENGICPNASNVFNPKEIERGKTITLCWTENPDSGLSLALSFVTSMSTRTTMNITKILDWKKEGKEISMFFINSVNSQRIWKDMSDFDLRFLFIKHGLYKEGYMDDNIGAYYICGAAPKDEDSLLPLAYDGHCSFDLFDSEYKASKDQLVVINENFPKEYNFYFEDRESNVINVFGRLITDKDLEGADSKEIDSYFDVQPVSSIIGNPETETEEEKNQRESLENSARSQNEVDKGEGESEGEGEKEEEKNESENIRWYSKIDLNESNVISDFNQFKSFKYRILEKEGGEKSFGQEIGGAIDSFFGGEEPKKEEKPEEEKKKESEEEPDTPSIRKIASTQMVNTTSEFDENFKNLLNGVSEPIPFAIYFVELREYADPDLRNLYKPGSFMNFSLTEEALKVSDGSSLEGLIQVNNLDVLIDVKKGTYDFSSEETEEVSSRKEDEGKEIVKGSDTIRTSYLGKEKEDIGKIEQMRPKEILRTMDRVDSSVLSDLGIGEWSDVTSIKVIRDRDRNIKSIKIKNSKADIGDKSRKIEATDPNFESAKKLLNAYQDKKTEEEEEERR